MMPLRGGETIPLTGITHLRVLRGSVTVLGTVMKPSTHIQRVVAIPHLASLPVLEVDASDEIPLFGEFSQPSYIDDSAFEGFECVVCVNPRLAPPAEDIPTITISQQWRSVARIFALDVCAKYPDPAVIIFGPKGSGKSTFCRYLVNTCLSNSSQVCLLDVDVGQPEISPPGLVSLHLLTTPLLSLPHSPDPQHQCISRCFFGHTTPNGDPVAYMHAIEQVLASAPRGIPLIVNCHGWMQGVGELTCQALLALVKPQLAVKLGKEGETGEFFSHLENNGLSKSRVVDGVVYTHLVGHSPSEAASRISVSQADLRWLRTTCYFNPSLQLATSWQASRPRDFFPHCEKMILNDPRIIFTDCTRPSDDLLHAALAFCLVGLCSGNNCVGLGVVASYDRSVLTIYVPAGSNWVVDTVMRSSGLNWFPQECAFFESSGSLVKTATCRIEEPFNLSRVLGGESGRNPKNRTNLGRKRLTWKFLSFKLPKTCLRLDSAPRRIG